MLGSPSNYATEVARDNPLMWFRMDETTGTVAYNRSVRTANVGDLFRQVTPGQRLSPVGRPAMFFGARDNGRIRIGNVPIMDGDATFEAWVYPLVVEHYMGLIDGYGGAPAVDGYSPFSLNIWGNGSLWYFHNDGTQREYRSDTGVVAANAWHHVAATRAGTALTLFVNGRIVGQTSLAGLPTKNNNGWCLGHSGATDLSINGYLADAAIYDRALPASRVLSHYRGAFTRPTLATGAALLSSLPSAGAVRRRLVEVPTFHLPHL